MRGWQQLWSSDWVDWCIWTGPIASSGASPSTIKLVLITSLTGPRQQIMSVPRMGSLPVWIYRMREEGSTATRLFLSFSTIRPRHGSRHGHSGRDLKSAFALSSRVPSFSAAKYAQQAGIPVTGSSADGPEWERSHIRTCSLRYRKHRSVLSGKYHRRLVLETGRRLSHRSYGFGISPSSARSAMGTARRFNELVARLAAGYVGSIRRE